MAIVIDLELDARKQDRAFKSLLDSLDRVERTFNVLNANLLQMASNMRAVASASQGVRAPRPARAPGGRAPSVQPPPFDYRNVLGNPYWQSLANAGDPYAAQMVNKANAQAASVARAQGVHAGKPPVQPDFMSNLASLLMRSRYGAGGGAMPLGMDVFRLFGGSTSGAAGAAPKGGAMLTVAIAAVIVALKALEAGLKLAAEHLAKLANTFVMGGGPVGTAEAAMRIGGFAGADLAEMVKGRSGLNKAFGMAAGVSPFAGHDVFDPLGANKAGVLLAKKIGEIADRSGTEAAMAFAHRAGVAPLGKLALLDKGTRERLIGSQGTNMGQLRAGAKLDAELAIFLTELKKLAVNLLTPALEKINFFLEDFNRRLEFVNSLFQKLYGWLEDIAKWVMDKFGIGKGSKQKSAVDRNSDSLDKNTEALRDAMGVFGGGRRAHGAVPANVMGNYGGFDSEALRWSVRQGAL